MKQGLKNLGEAYLTLFAGIQQCTDATREERQTCADETRKLQLDRHIVRWYQVKHRVLRNFTEWLQQIVPEDVSERFPDVLSSKQGEIVAKILAEDYDDESHERAEN